MYKFYFQITITIIKEKKQNNGEKKNFYKGNCSKYIVDRHFVPMLNILLSFNIVAFNL